MRSANVRTAGKAVTRRAIIAALVLLPVAGTILRPALAAEPEINAPGGIALSGYDPVAYFTEGKPVMGLSSLALKWHGATWYFATPENLEAFEMNPMAYMPRYGGYCAYAVAKGSLAPGDPDAFTIHDGRLYLNYSPEIRAIWRQDIATYVAMADRNWPSVLGR